MAIGPQKLTVSTANLLTFAENIIDATINSAKIYPVCVPTDAIAIDYVTFTKMLVPKYLNAGWRVVDWRQDTNNNRWYIYLSV